MIKGIEKETYQPEQKGSWPASSPQKILLNWAQPPPSSPYKHNVRSRENESEPERIWGREKAQLERGRRKWNSRRGFGRVVLVGWIRVMGLMSKNGNIGPVIFYITQWFQLLPVKGRERERWRLIWWNCCHLQLWLWWSVWMWDWPH